MKLRLLLNIGHADAKRLGLADATHGSIVDVDDVAGAELLERGWAAELPGRKAKGVPAVDLKAVPE
jgi:hypothetical protein